MKSLFSVTNRERRTLSTSSPNIPSFFLERLLNQGIDPRGVGLRSREVSEAGEGEGRR